MQNNTNFGNTANNNTQNNNFNTQTTQELSAVDAKIKKVGAKAAKSSTELNVNLADIKIFEPEDALSLLEFKPGSKIVDLGSGQGHFVLSLAKILDKESQIYGVDVQKDLLIKMLKEAKQQNLNNVFAVWDDLDEAKELKIPNASFDYVFIVNTLFQMENPKNALVLAYKLLKNGGKLVVIEWRDDIERNIGPRKEQSIKKAWLLQELQDLGFVLMEEYELGDYHYMLVLNKVGYEQE